uniref:Cyclin-like domain-containing protein n=1 Tax=Musca domestica TaxID=7370 RepID=A0A1I8ML62_MUSDO
MDLLCTENIIHEYETETLCHHQQTLQKQSTSSSSPLKTEQKQLQQSSISNNNSNISPTSLYSSSSSLSSSSCCSSTTNSSGYNSTGSSSSSSSSSCHSSKVVACEETANSAYLETCAPTQHQQPPHNQKHSSSSGSVTSSTGQNVYTNHLIHRSLDYVNTATEDPTYLTDRCLENALKAEEKRPQPICTYFKTIQKDITPPMRKIVAEWMMEVCAEEKCQEEVVLLALNYMDRFLSTKSVRKTHLQILAAACLLLASKLREPSCRALSAELLVFYTDNSIHKADLIIDRVTGKQAMLVACGDSGGGDAPQQAALTRGSQWIKEADWVSFIA